MNPVFRQDTVRDEYSAATRDDDIFTAICNVNQLIDPDRHLPIFLRNDSLHEDLLSRLKITIRSN